MPSALAIPPSVSPAWTTYSEVRAGRLGAGRRWRASSRRRVCAGRAETARRTAGGGRRELQCLPFRQAVWVSDAVHAHELIDGQSILGRDCAERLARLHDVLRSVGDVRHQRAPSEQARQDQHGEHESNDLSRHESSHMRGRPSLCGAPLRPGHVPTSWRYRPITCRLRPKNRCAAEARDTAVYWRRPESRRRIWDALRMVVGGRPVARLVGDRAGSTGGAGRRRVGLWGPTQHEAKRAGDSRARRRCRRQQPRDARGGVTGQWLRGPDGGAAAPRRWPKRASARRRSS